MVVRLYRRESDQHYGYAQLASELAGEAILRVLGISDALAKKKKDRRRKEYAEMCSKGGSEHNPHCKEPLAVLEFCTNSRSGEIGTAVSYNFV